MHYNIRMNNYKYLARSIFVSFCLFNINSNAKINIKLSALAQVVYGADEIRSKVVYSRAKHIGKFCNNELFYTNLDQNDDYAIHELYLSDTIPPMKAETSWSFTPAITLEISNKHENNILIGGIIKFTPEIRKDFFVYRNWGLVNEKLYSYN